MSTKLKLKLEALAMSSLLGARGLTVLAVAAVVLLIPAVALAAYPKFAASVAPNTPGAHSKLNVFAKSPYNGLADLGSPVELLEQKGFRASARSVSVLCPIPVSKHSAHPCPKGSEIGSGSALAEEPSNSLAVLRLYLAKPKHKGDIASIVVAVRADFDQNVVGRLFKTSRGRIETVFPSPWGAFDPYGSFSLIRFRLRMHAVRGRYSLVTNPSRCSRGHWSATLKLGTASKNIPIPCSA